MDENKNDVMNVPYVVYESAQTRMESVNKRLVVALIISVIIAFLSNAIWLWAWMQYDYVGEDTQIDLNTGNGNANFVGEDGIIYNGKDSDN